MKKGITATSAAVMVVIMIILIGTVSIASYNSVQNAKKLVFALEISEIQEEVTKYYNDSEDDSYPVTAEVYTVDLTEVTSSSINQFDAETKDANNQIILYELDFDSIDISERQYGKKENEKDVYLISKETGTVYYLAGIKAKDVTYYTLTQDLIDIKDRNEKENSQETYDAPNITTAAFIVNVNDLNEKNIYLTNIEVDGEGLTKIKYVNGLIDEDIAYEYFKNNGSNLSTDRIKVREGDYITIYAENSSGAWSIRQEGIPTIPEGFYYVGGSIPTGVVISDSIDDSNKGTSSNGDVISEGLSGNQFVWIPVLNVNEFERRDGYGNGVPQTYVSSGNTSEPFSKGTLSKDNDLTEEFAEYAKMVESVEKYNGFYIGRYEAGSTVCRTSSSTGTSPLIPSKQNVYAYNWSGWGISMTDIDDDVEYENVNRGKGAVYLARTAYPENDSYSVASHLIYGVQWDAIMKYLEKIENPYGKLTKYYISDSTNMGWYSNNASYNTTRKTGVDVTIDTDNDGIVDIKGTNKVNNIYDLAGNLAEWTMEASGGTVRFIRGSYFANDSSNTPASYRNTYYPYYVYGYLGFRIAIYIK